MGIDPMLYEKYSGRKGDPYSRLGEALAKGDAKQARRDTMAKGVAGGMRAWRYPGEWVNILMFWRWLRHSSRKD